MGTRDAAAVAAGLGRSSSRVADCNSLKPKVSENGNAREFDKPPSHNLFSCFVAKSAAAAAVAKKKKSPSSNSSQWPRSPSHLMSRLLLSPDMNPASPAAGEQSPARWKSRFRRRQNNRGAAAQREYFSGPLLGGGSSSNKKNDMFEAAGVAKDEPTSPKVTCMGTVKAPKKHQKEEKAAAKRDSRPPKWKESLKNFSGPLDLSRFGQNSGELAAPPSCKKKHQQQQQQKGNCVFGKSLLALQQQKEQKEWAAAVEESRTRDWPASLKNLRIVVQKRDAADEDGEFSRCKKSLTIMMPTDSSTNCLEKNSSAEKNEQQQQQQQPAMRKADEICIWKRRCIAQPMKLDIRRD